MKKLVTNLSVIDFLVVTFILVVAFSSLTSCEEPQVIPAIEKNLVASISNPYYSSVGGGLSGVPAYFLIKKPIGSNRKMSYFPVWANPYTGNPYDDAGMIFFKPVEYELTIQFGSEVTYDTVENFIREANEEIKTRGGVVVSANYSTGPASLHYNVIKIRW